MLVVGHRGASQEALENSWQAFELCVAMGADRIELDLRLSLDNQVFIIHNPSTRHAASESHWVSKTKAKTLAKVKLRNGEDIPSLTPLLQRFLPAIELNLEIKTANTRLARIVAQHVTACPHKDKIIVSSFNSRQLATFLRLCPKGQAAFLWGKYPRLTSEPLAVMADLGIKIFHPEVKSLTAKLMEQARKRDLTIVPWISAKDEIKDRIAVWQKLLDFGVDGFCTNFPRELIAWQKGLKKKHATKL